MLKEWFVRLFFFFKGKPRVEVDEELRFHLQTLIEQNLAAGMNEVEARRKASVAFGGWESTREKCREQRPSWTLELVLRDLRFAIRGLWRNPGLTAVAVLTLALAIGASSAIFSLLNQAILQALPVRDPQQLVVLSFAGASPGHVHTEGGDAPDRHHEFTYPMYRDLRDHNNALSGLIAEASTTAGVTWNNHAEEVSAELVSGNYFDVLGVPPAVGRLLESGDETAPLANPVAAISFDFWKDHLNQAPVAGAILLINGTPFTITGVVAPGFRSMVWGHVPAIYVPITEQRILLPEWDLLGDRQSYWLSIMGRQRPDRSAAQASQEINTLFRNLRTGEFPAIHDQSARSRAAYISAATLHLDSGAKGFSPYRDQLRTPLAIVMGMVLLVTAMALVNVASLLLVRAATRVREFSVRYALGATTRQILRQLLSEGLLLGLLGTALGLAVVPAIQFLLLHWLAGASPDPPAFSATLDGRVLAFTLITTLLGSLLFSLAPAAQFWNPRLFDALRLQGNAAGSGSLKFRRTCVLLQISFCLLLMVGAGMFMRTIRNLRNVNPGFATDNLLAFSIAPELAGYSGARVTPVEQRVLESIAHLPGVRVAGATNDEDLADSNRGGDVIVDGYTPPPDEDFSVELPAVSDAYLQALEVPLVAGRLFQPSDGAISPKVAVVNESFARHFFVTPQSALGRHVSLPRRPSSSAVIVGVVRDVKHTSLRSGAEPICYTLFLQAERPSALTVYVRTWAPSQSAAREIRAAVASIDSNLILSKITTMREQIDQSLVAERTIAMLATTFGIVAALLAGIGLYGILAYSTANRTREIGIRMALGARRGTVVGLILRETMVLAAWAVAGTIPITILATRAVRSQLYAVSIADPAVYGVGVLTICLVALLAGFLPARRAATVEPARALRTD